MCDVTPEPLTIASLQRQHHALGRILRALGAIDQLQSTLDVIALACAEALEAVSASVVLHETPSAPPLVGALRPVPLVVPATPSGDACGLACDGADAAGGTLITLPLARCGHLLGTFQVRRHDGAAPFSVGEIAFARQVAEQAIVAIGRVRREADARRRVEHAEALREIGRELNAELDFARFLTVMRRVVARLVDHESCWLALWDEATDDLDFRLYIDDGERRPEMEIHLGRGLGLAWALVDERQTLRVPDYLGECARRGVLSTPAGSSPRTTTNPWLGVPLLTGGRIVGAMAVQRKILPFSEDDAAMLESLAGQIAAALENARLYSEARQLALCDPLTGLANHRHLHERLDDELARVAALEQPLAAVMIDLDNFKLLNDTYGHPIGDHVLLQVARALQDEAGPGDTIGRYGGDEFLAILPGADAPVALAYIERVRARVGQVSTGLGGHAAIPLTLSTGVAVYPHDARLRHDLVRLADQALYTSKHVGGRTVVTTNMRATLPDPTAHMAFEVIEGLVLAVDAKDHYTALHSIVVAEAAVVLARALGLPNREVAILHTAGMLHDVGKISIPDHILRKPGPLDEEEWRVMRQHVEFSELIVRGVPGLQDMLEPIMHHHERWDGRGYPQGLAGEAVPLLGRIMIVADAYSAMTLDRPYRRGLPCELALEHLRAGAGTQFDPALVAVLCQAETHNQLCQMLLAS